MRPRAGVSAILIASVGLMFVSGAARAQSLGLELSLTPDGDVASDVPVALRPGATQATAVVYIRQQAGIAIDAVKLVATTNGATVELTPDGGTPGSAAALPAGGLIRYTITVKDVAQRNVAGDITAVAGGTAQRLASLTITRPPSAGTLVIAGATETGINGPSIRRRSNCRS